MIFISISLENVNVYLFLDFRAKSEIGTFFLELKFTYHDLNQKDFWVLFEYYFNDLARKAFLTWLELVILNIYLWISIFNEIDLWMHCSSSR